MPAESPWPEQIWQDAATHLLKLGSIVRDCLRLEQSKSNAERAGIAKVEPSDVIYQIDLVSERAILAWFETKWTDFPPVELVMEGTESAGRLIYPSNAKEPEWICIIDPIDGTRGIMYDKRSAWFIAGLAPIHPDRTTTTADIAASVLVELPTSKAGYADAFSATKGCGKSGIFGERVQLFTGDRQAIVPDPFAGTDISHGFFSFAKFFPEGRETLTQLELEVIGSLNRVVDHGSPVVFDDQYMSTAGQFYEVLMGHDRAIIDARVEGYRADGLDAVLVCHPYDIAAWLILDEAGCVIERPGGGPLDYPMNTTTPVSWAAYANPKLAATVRPLLQQGLKKLL